MNSLQSDNIYADVDTRKNALYVVNPTLRNPDRLLELQYISSLIVRKFGVNTPISFQDFIDFTDSYATGFIKFSNNSLDTKVNSFCKRLSELKILGLINFQIKNNTIIFKETEFSHISFNPEGYSREDDDFNFLEVNSNFLLFVLSKRNSILFITSLIKEVERIWNVDLKRKRFGLADIELEHIYITLPFLKNRNEHHVKYIANLIVNNRLKYEELNNKISYREFYSNELNLLQNCHRNFTFLEEKTAKDYIDVLFRTLECTCCFKLINQFTMYSVTINDDFYSKLSFYLTYNFDKIKNFLFNDALVSELNSHEKKFFKEIGLSIQKPIVFRYEKQEKARKSFYLTDDLEEHKEKIFFYKNKKNLLWHEFEDYNNLLMTFFVKKELNKKLTKDNLKYAIKLDQFGNVKNSTTGGVADLSIFIDNFTIVVESSLLIGLQARKNEVAPVLTHVNNIYYENKKTTICFIVFEKEAFHGIQHDYIDHNLSNLLFDKDIVYIPISSDYFFEIMFSNPCSLLELSQEIKSKLAHFTEDIKRISYTRNLLFSDFNIKLT